MPVPFAHPLISGQKLELVKSLVARAQAPRRGIKATQKELLSPELSEGLVVLARDTTPADLISHIPALCEEKGIKYLFVESRFDLLTAAGQPSTCYFFPRSEIDKEVWAALCKNN